MNPIGGYFELELRNGREYHKTNISLNSGRNALELILRTRNYQHVLIPYFICDNLLEPFKKLGVKYTFYKVDINFEPVIDLSQLKSTTAILYINYFGLKGLFIKKLSEICRNLIIDNSQAFFAKPLPDVDTFYSARKFFGVPDGAYLYMKNAPELNFAKDVSSDRIVHLVKRIEQGSEAGYDDFIQNEKKIIGEPIKNMSALTHSLLRNIDYKHAIRKRRSNFDFLHKVLSEYNELNFDFEEDFVPMVYPLLINNTDIRQQLIKKKIFVATYWPNVLEWVEKDSLEAKFTNNLLPLPIDQRYGKAEMSKIIKVIGLK